MTNRHTLRFLKVLIPVLLALSLITGIVLLYTNQYAYNVFTTEDGFVESLTVIALLGGCFLSLTRFFRLKKQKKALFLVSLLLISFVCFFGAGEEISWGQRILNIKSSEFFMTHNAQGETNIHNLVFGGLKLNKLIFSLLLGVAVFCFLFVLPFIYRKSDKIKQLVGKLAIPVPKIYQIVFYIILFVTISIIHDSRKWEMLEMGGAMLFLLVLLDPLNIELFNPGTPQKIKQTQASQEKPNKRKPANQPTKQKAQTSRHNKNTKKNTKKDKKKKR